MTEKSQIFSKNPETSFESQDDVHGYKIHIKNN